MGENISHLQAVSVIKKNEVTLVTSMKSAKYTEVPKKKVLESIWGWGQFIPIY